MAGAVCFTHALDGIHCAYGPFAWKGPQVIHQASDSFGEFIRSKFTGIEGDEVDSALAHAAQPGCSVAILFQPGQPTVALLAKPQENEGAPPRPEQWMWRTLRDAFMEERP